MKAHERIPLHDHADRNAGGPVNASTIVIASGGGGTAGGGGSSDLASHVAAGDPHTGYVAKAIVDAKGDLIAATAADTVARVAVGTNGYVLTADSTATAGVAWAAATGARFEVVMVSGSVPPDPVLNSAGDDWIYSS